MKTKLSGFPFVGTIKIFLMLLLCFTMSGVMAQNLISNGDIEAGCTGWWSGAGGGGAGTFTCPVTGAGNIHAGTNALRSNITAVGANAWDVQTIHSGITATIGVAHTLTFWAKASVAGRQMRLVVQNTTYAAQDYTLTNAWAQYTFVFTPTEASLQVKIHYTQTGDFYFDDFVIIDPSGGPSPITTTITPATAYQNMIGFGGALTWYSERIMTMSAANRTAIYNLMFSDLGADIIRLKSWYYPNNYPTVKTTTTMDPTWFKASFDATNQFYTEAKTRNPNIDVLLCSWSPPKALKSNNNINEGTLKQNTGQFMYKEFAQYWVDILDNITFVPDYISIQNEPGYTNPGWETCEWRPTETGGFPGYDRALDSVYNRIKTRPTVPKMIGAEPENLGAAFWNTSLNTFREMCNPIKPKPHLYGYAYHLYNYAGGAGSISPTNLNMIRDEFGDRMNFMTEFSSTNYNWIDVARMIHANLVEANNSAYIYWELVWDDASTSTMIGLDNAGNYNVKDNYYAIKHYSKFVDKGYKRIAATGSNATLNVTAFLNPAKTQITVVAINNHASTQPLNVSLAGATISSAALYRSVAGNYWQSLGTVNLATTQNLPGKSLNTYVIDVTGLPVELISLNAKREDNNAVLDWTTASEQNNAYFEVEHSLDGNKFEKIGKVTGSGTTASLQQYTFIHQNVNADQHYYRLRQVDYSGVAKLSPIVSLGKKKSSIETEIPTLSPVPFDRVLSVTTGSLWEDAELTVYNTQGSIFYQGTTTGTTTQLITENYPSGLYLLRFQSGERTLTLKAVK